MLAPGRDAAGVEDVASAGLDVAGHRAVEAGREMLQVRIILIGIGVATFVLLLLTLFRLFFHPGELPSIPVIWLGIYILDPLLVAFGLWYMRTTKSPESREKNTLSSLWVAQTVIFAAVGLLMMLLPGVAVRLWPWGLTEPLAQPVAP